LGQCVITKKQYDVLEQNYNELLFEKSNVIDSLEHDNFEKHESIVKLETEIVILNETLDSLYNIKKDINKSKSNFTISSSISEGAELLKRNLNEKTINYSS
jgi:hypothetical protein